MKELPEVLSMIHWTRIVESGAISFIWAIVKRMW